MAPAENAPAGGGGAQRSWRGTTASLRAAERRTRLLAAGLQLFGTQGYASTTIDAICSEAGTSPRYFYESFATKEQLLLAVYDDTIQHAYRIMRNAVDAADASLEPRVLAGVTSLVHAITDDRRRARVALLEPLGVSPTLAQRRHEVLRVFAEYIAGEALSLIRGGAPLRHSAYTVLGLVGATHELLIDWMLRPEPPSIDRLIQEIVFLFRAVSTYRREAPPSPGRTLGGEGDAHSE